VTEKSVSPLVIEVQCYAGYRGEQEPLSVRFAEHAVRVVEILDRWLSPDHRYFKFRGDDGARYIIRHDEHAQRWELILYDGRGQATKEIGCCE
jgi:hypothetical protein